jgi:hypothetical protein
VHQEHPTHIQQNNISIPQKLRQEKKNFYSKALRALLTTITNGGASYL